MSREKTVLILTIVGCLMSLPFALNAGNIGFVDEIVSTYGLPLIGFAEVMIFGWVYGADRLRSYINKVSDFKIGRWWTWLIKIVIPVALGYGILGNILKQPGLVIVLVIILAAILASINSRLS
ncbi:MAG: Sodium:neurotransmitter symporter family protein [Candidatus Methanolliviera sp. GoM_asphalt]|nr:MAG: Sodium:neurotransmitter symporter family protein [Candidatus Methanolliviera sp. GoM_asphalt]